MYTTRPVPKNAVIYSFGVGTNIDWDVEMIKQGATVHAFDPSPKSIDWLQTLDTPAQFFFTPYGIAPYDGFMPFYPPPNPNNVSYSTFRTVGEPRMLQVKRPVQTRPRQ